VYPAWDAEIVGDKIFEERLRVDWKLTSLLDQLSESREWQRCCMERRTWLFICDSLHII